MGSKRLVLNVAIVILLVLALMFSYKRGWLNPVLPAKWREQHPGPLKSGFVGDTGRYPAMQNCLAYPGPGMRWSNFNRCDYV